MDHRFREGLQITVRYSVAATIRLSFVPCLCLSNDRVSTRQTLEGANDVRVLESPPSVYSSRSLYRSCTAVFALEVVEYPEQGWCRFR
jgi:hypothetical protein